ncbi:MAG TPA: adenylate/guanylate cyclase domain-containing protein [Gemmatimonadaceae bacterium]
MIPKKLLIAFLDFTEFKVQSLRVKDIEIAETLDAVYALVARAVDAAGGNVVKFIGDAALVVFPEKAVDAGVRALLELKPSLDRFMSDRNWDCRLHVRVHFGEVIAGQFGPEGDKRFDVIGRNVNAAAMLKPNGITLSAEAFRKLSPKLRKSFKEHAPEVTYVPADAPGRSHGRQ